jgi:hypothetical protein
MKRGREFPPFLLIIAAAHVSNALTGASASARDIWHASALDFPSRQERAGRSQSLQARDGVGVIQEMPGAFSELISKITFPKQFYRDNCRNDDFGSCVVLGMLEYEEGNMTRARYLFADACEVGLASACMARATVEIRAEDLGSARAFLERACLLSGGQQGDLGCRTLSDIDARRARQGRFPAQK